MEKERRKIMIKICIIELFGIECFIVQGGLMWIVWVELVVVVVNVGGIGFMIVLSFFEVDLLWVEIWKCWELMDKLFGVNFIFLFFFCLIDYLVYIEVCIDEGIKFIEIVG